MELMNIIFLRCDRLMRGRKARETRRGATVQRFISSAKTSRSLIIRGVINDNNQEDANSNFGLTPPRN